MNFKIFHFVTRQLTFFWREKCLLTWYFLSHLIKKNITTYLLGVQYAVCSPPTYVTNQSIKARLCPHFLMITQWNNFNYYKKNSFFSGFPKKFFFYMRNVLYIFLLLLNFVYKWKKLFHSVMSIFLWYDPNICHYFLIKKRDDQ